MKRHRLNDHAKRPYYIMEESVLKLYLDCLSGLNSNEFEASVLSFLLKGSTSKGFSLSMLSGNDLWGVLTPMLRAFPSLFLMLVTTWDPQSEGHVPMYLSLVENVEHSETLLPHSAQKFAPLREQLNKLRDCFLNLVYLFEPLLERLILSSTL